MPSTPVDFLTSNSDKKMKTACLVISGILNMLSGGSLVLTKYATVVNRAGQCHNNVMAR